ncbi:hypothetical protein BSLG_005677 [Batrachochytrium salamandrivorans]|nr:hypothetical protein BSLG_005677 [Batrachochytrium salamandrivorans]
MLKAMMLAPVGDDVYSEDPTVNLLEQTVAELSGKRGSIVLHKLPFELIFSSRHTPFYAIPERIFSNIASGVNFHCSAAVIPVTPATSTGHLVAAEVEKHLVLSDDVHYAPTQLICLENTLNGSIFPQSDIEYFDTGKNTLNSFAFGWARLWNASAETGISIKTCANHLIVAWSTSWVCSSCPTETNMIWLDTKPLGMSADDVSQVLEKHVSRLLEDLDLQCAWYCIIKYHG